MHRIEDYAVIGDTQTAALVNIDGSIDWLCFPRFDSPSCFAALLGDRDNGRWLLAPKAPIRSVTRRYVPGTLVLETEFTTGEGVVRVIDCMPLNDHATDVVRMVEGVSGRVTMTMELVVRFDYGSRIPWVTSHNGEWQAIAGPDLVSLATPVEVRGEAMRTVADFAVSAGDRVPFVLTWRLSHLRGWKPVDAERELARTTQWWQQWSGRSTYRGDYADAVERSLVTLKGLTFAPTGGIVAAATTSLPEHVGGVRNWDYRFCWLRDATFTLMALMSAGYVDEAAAWREWLLRAVAGSPDQLQIMYGVAGERRLTEYEIPWLAGFAGSAPVRIGNKASEQFQLDVYGEVLDALSTARSNGMAPENEAWSLQGKLMEFLEGNWRREDEGLWEVRGPRRHFTHSKVMAWVAADRAARSVAHGFPGSVERWTTLRDEIRAEVCAEAWDDERRTFTQSYGSRQLDAATLLIPIVGFLPPDDPRVAGTVEACEKELLVNGLLLRYSTEEPHVDGLPPGEGAFLACSFWLADNYQLLGRTDDAVAMFERLLALRNDVGLLAEEYDPVARRQLGNFPQAFSHVPLVNTAVALSRGKQTSARAAQVPTGEQA
ncbi:MAG: glucoamylase [Frankiales bacterium]|nr:glucoamylase [Frankiales bacterium]